MAKPGKTPVVNDKTLTLWDYESNSLIMKLDITSTRDWPHWQQWLAGAKSFRYVADDGTACSVVKESRRNGKLFVWYAHKRLAGKLRRRYIGQNENVTYRKLRQVAFELSQRELL